MEIVIALAGVVFFVWVGVMGDKKSSKHLRDFFDRD